MNRIAGRALITVILAAALVFGMVAFTVEFSTSASDWAVFSGAPHVYSNGEVAAIIADSTGIVLANLYGERTYSSDTDLRESMLHWTGDTQGNIDVPYLYEYKRALSGYDLLNGLYTYGEGKSVLTLTLSASVQKAALEALGEHKGTVAVYNYQTGEILCAVSTPTFDPENVPDIEHDTQGRYDGVYLNRFMQSSYTPGSIFKIVTLAAALELLPDAEELTFYCNQTYEMDGGEVTCEGWHGEQNLKDAFANSCNCAFAQLVEKIGKEQLARYVAQFGITQPIRFDGMTTIDGNFDISTAAAVEQAWGGIGQYTDLVNPCRFLTFVGTIARGGGGVQPHVVKQIDAGGKTTYRANPVFTERIMSIGTAQRLQAYLRNNVETVYGSENFPNLTVCAKSGTGEIGSGTASNAMFAGFVADEAYPLAFIVAVEEGGYGARMCVPILSSVLAACVEAMDHA